LDIAGTHFLLSDPARYVHSFILFWQFEQDGWTPSHCFTNELAEFPINTDAVSLMGGSGNRFPTFTLLPRQASQAVVTYFRFASFLVGAILKDVSHHLLDYPIDMDIETSV
jgi:hypothetical protein